MKQLKNPIVILSIFVVFQFYKMIEFLQVGTGPRHLYVIRIVVPFVMAGVSFFAIQGKTIQGRKIMLWIMAVNLLATFPAIFLGLALPVQQYALKIIMITFGSYFTYGGVILIRHARNLEMN